MVLDPKPVACVEEYPKSMRESVMLNKCNCGSDATYAGLLGKKHLVMCSSQLCNRHATGVHLEMAEFKWNNRNPIPVLPPEDFEARFAKSLESISDDCLCVTSGKFLRLFAAHFGFDLKEVTREQWQKEVCNDG